MELDDFATVVAVTLDNVRASLGAIEDAAQADDDPKWLHLSRHYAGLVGPLRDYLTGHQTGRPLPRGLAKRISDGSAALLDFEAEIAQLGLHPDLTELTELIRLAASAG